MTQLLVREEIQAPAARAAGLTKCYHRGTEQVRALDGVDLTLETGEFAAIVGPSGSGKSTLMNLLGCMDWPTSGRLWIVGEEVASLGDAGLTRIRRAQIGFIFQQFHLLPTLTVLENVVLPATFGGGPARKGIGSSGLAERARELLSRVGLERRLGHRPSQLSGGEMQRVAIARALINNPRLLLADEPTGNLDTEASAAVLELFQELNEAGQTIVLVTHNPDLAARTRRIIRLRDGRIAEDGRRRA